MSPSATSGSITAIIGPNGAGKTTVFNCLTGFYKPTIGRLTLHHPARGPMLLERMEGFRIPQRAGVARTFQNIRLFGGMSVLENLIVAQHNQLMRASAFSVAGLFGLGRYLKRRRKRWSAEYWLERVGLTDRADWTTSSLPYGDQRRLEIARAMRIRPVLLCSTSERRVLRETAALNGLLISIRDEQEIGVLLIEHDMSVVMQISDHVIVLDYGRKIAEGPPAQVRNEASGDQGVSRRGRRRGTAAGGGGRPGAQRERLRC